MTSSELYFGRQHRPKQGLQCAHSAQDGRPGSGPGQVLSVLFAAVEQMLRTADTVLSLQDHCGELERKYHELLERSAAERRQAKQLLDEAEQRVDASRAETRSIEVRMLAAQEQLAQITGVINGEFASGPLSRGFPSPLALPMPNSGDIASPPPASFHRALIRRPGSDRRQPRPGAARRSAPA